MSDERLHSIGEFARRTRLPVSTLRYYHELGLLVPHHVDPSSGYRYYRSDQLASAVLISELRAIGVAPAAIGDVVRGHTPLDELVDRERARLTSEISVRRDAIDRLARLTATADHTATAATMRPMEPREVPALSGEVRAEHARADILRLVAALRRRLRSELGKPVETGIGFGAVFDLDLEADPMSVTVFADVDCASDVSAALPGGMWAAATHEGNTDVALTYQSILERIDAEGSEPVGPVVERYRGSREAPVIDVMVLTSPPSG